jgi:hypothetical protein
VKPAATSETEGWVLKDGNVCGQPHNEEARRTKTVTLTDVFKAVNWRLYLTASNYKLMLRIWQVLCRAISLDQRFKLSSVCSRVSSISWLNFCLKSVPRVFNVQLLTMKPMSMALIPLLAFAEIASAQNPASYEVNLPGQPFGVVVSRDLRWVFVSLSGGGPAQGAGIAVLRNDHGHVEMVRVVATDHSPAGMVLTHDGDMLIAAANDSVVFFDTQRLETGGSDAAFQWVNDSPNAGSIYVNVTFCARRQFRPFQRQFGKELDPDRVGHFPHRHGAQSPDW